MLWLIFTEPRENRRSPVRGQRTERIGINTPYTYKHLYTQIHRSRIPRIQMLNMHVVLRTRFGIPVVRGMVPDMVRVCILHTSSCQLRVTYRRKHVKTLITTEVRSTPYEKHLRVLSALRTERRKDGKMRDSFRPDRLQPFRSARAKEKKSRRMFSSSGISSHLIFW